MRTRIGFIAVLALSVLAAHAAANDAQPDVHARMDEFDRRLKEMETRHQAELKARDEKIAELNSRLESQHQQRVANGDRIEREKQDILQQIDSRQAPPFSLRSGQSFNPDIAVITDFLASFNTRRENEAHNRFDVREVELDIRAPVHPRADGVVILAFERDAHNPVFEEHHDDEMGDDDDEEEHDHEGVESKVSIEEAYLYIHDTGVDNLTAKIGRFHLRFGRQNMLHLHDLPTSDPPLVNQAFLAPEALIDSGISLSYVVPPALVFDQYIEAIVEVVTGEGADSESPTLAGDLAIDSPAVNVHLLWNSDLAPGWNFELGGSFLRGHADEDNALDVCLYGIDATLLHRDPTGGFNNQLFQAEAIHGVIDTDEGATERGWGAYFLAQQQLDRDWYAGVRFDWTENPHDDDEETWAVSPYVSWYWNEFLRFRLQYEHKAGDVDTENIVFLQATWVFGAHPPHPYWTAK